MTWLRIAAKALLDLFVDDDRLALSLLAWIAAMAILARFDWLSPQHGGPLLAAGVLGLLVTGVARAARRRLPPSP